VTLLNFIPGRDFVQLQGYDAGAGAAALPSAVISGGSEVLTLPDGTTLTFQGVTGLTSGSFA
jgi:hypothetical protein